MDRAGSGFKLTQGERNREMKTGKPCLFISYALDGQTVKRGPYYTASPDGMDPQKWVAYQVQDENFQFLRITVPWYHSLTAVQF